MVRSLMTEYARGGYVSGDGQRLWIDANETILSSSAARAVRLSFPPGFWAEDWNSPKDAKYDEEADE